MECRNTLGFNQVTALLMGLSVLFSPSFSQAEDGLKNFKFSYHRKLVDTRDRSMPLSEKLLTSSQDQYLQLLLKSADKKVQREVKAILQFLKESKISKREKAHIKYAAIDVLLKRVKRKDNKLIAKKNTAIKHVIDAVFIEKPFNQKARRLPVTKATIAYMKRSSGQNGLAIIFEILIQAFIDALNDFLASNTDYQNECIFAGVPMPPDWGSAEWQNLGILNDEFASDSYTATVFVYNSNTPEGTCVALPRTYTGSSEARFFGVICLGVASENACFWDESYVETSAQFRIQDRLAGGTDMPENGDQCTDCHAGENPFVSRPESSVLSFNGFSTDTNWYTPIGVHASWPQNPGPTNLLDNVDTSYTSWFSSQTGESCIQCHQFPEVSQLPGYCNSVLKESAQNTMPSETDPAGWSSPNGSEYRNHVRALRQACP